MNTIGNTALKMEPDPQKEAMVNYLSAEGGYWLENDQWRTDSAAYEKSGLASGRWEGVLVDFSSYEDEWQKLEMKYYVLYCLKHQWKTPFHIQNVCRGSIAWIGKDLSEKQFWNSFKELDKERLLRILDGARPKAYPVLLQAVIDFFQEYYEEQEETEKDIWNPLKIPGAKLSASLKRQHPSLVFTEIPETYRPSVKRFMRRLVTRRSWSYCMEMLMYIRYFFRTCYENGYTDGFLEKLNREDVEGYLFRVAEDYAGRNATVRSKAVSYIRYWLDYIQMAEYPQAPEKSIERLIFDEDIPRRERASDTIEKVRYIPAHVIQQLDASIGQIEPAEMRPVYVLLRETGWRGTDILNLRYDNCLQYIWNSKENRSVPYLCGEITKVGIPMLKDPVSEEVAEMVRELAEETERRSTPENNPDRYLFNCFEGKSMGLPYSKPAFSEAIQNVIDRNEIRDTDGSLFHFRAHGLRHTRAMEYAEQGMPIGIIQRLLGHCSLQMSLHYAKVSEDTLYQKWKETEKLDLFKTHAHSPAKETEQGGQVHYEKVRNNLDAVRVPFGVCFKPSKAGCRRQTEQCMECASFCSTRDNLKEYDAEIENVREMIRIGETLGRDEWVRKNQDYLACLEKTRDRIKKEGIIHKNSSLREA